MEKNSLIFVAGHRGLVGSAIVRELQRNGYENLLLRTSSELDLRDQCAVRDFFEKEKPDYVVLAAARVGGIGANSRFRAQMIYDNLMIQSNVIDSSYKAGVKKLLFLGSSCIYPRLAPQPMREEHLLTSELEYTNEPYAIAKIAGLKMCEAYNLNYGTDFISVMPTNLYGENDNFDLENGHVLPVLIRKFHEAKKNGDEFVKLWGSGRPKREFLHVDDLAKASLMLLEKVSFKDLFDEAEKEVRNTHINIGTGVDVTVAELAELIKEVVGFEGNVKWDSDMPDGTPRKLLDISKIRMLGWEPEIGLKEGIESVYNWYKSKYE
jgi:GDP-L-fucose synthase